MTARAGALHRLRGDAALLRRFRAGDDSAFAALHDRYAAEIRAYARHMLRGTPHDPEDAAQEVFLRAYQALRRDRRDIEIRPWLFRVAHNRCIDVLRAPRTERLADEPAAPPGPDTAAAVEDREAFRALLRDIGGLTDAQRSALLLRELGGLSHGAVAEALGISEVASRMLVRRARLALTDAAEARDATCADVRRRLTEAADAGHRPRRGDLRHLDACPECAAFRRAQARVERELSLLVPGSGLAALLKLSGGGGAAAVGAATGASGGAGGGLVAKLAVGACCAAIGAGTAATIATDAEHRERRPAPAPRAATPAPAARPTTTTTSPATAPSGNRAARRSAAQRSRPSEPRRRDRDAAPRQQQAAAPEAPVAPATVDLGGFDEDRQPTPPAGRAEPARAAETVDLADLGDG